MTKKSELSLYIHIPFCVRKCLYCDFLSGPASALVIERYIEALAREIELAGMTYGTEAGTEVSTIFFGGGTPTLLTAGQFDHLMTVLAMNFTIRDDAEITTECNPGTVDASKLDTLRKIGFNRLSIGVQSFQDEELKALGRIHTAGKALRTIDEAFKAGFTNISVDLMSGIPGQTIGTYEDSLKAAAETGVTHISAYSLIVEDGTPYNIRYGNGRRKEADEALLHRLDLLPELPDEETEREMYYRTKTMLESYGFRRYEISNYAKNGYESRHNTGYWREHAYLGFGVGAASFVFTDACKAGDLKTGEKKTAYGVRFRNTENMSEYCDALLKEQALRLVRREMSARTKEDAMEEFMFLGLRMMDGVSLDTFKEHFGASIEEIYGGIPSKQIGSGLLVCENGRLFLTERGIDLSNAVMSDYILT